MGRPLYPNYPHKGDMKEVKKRLYETATKPIFEQEAVPPVVVKAKKKKVP